MEILWYISILLLGIFGIVLIILGKVKNTTLAQQSSASGSSSSQPHYSNGSQPHYSNNSQPVEIGVVPKQFRIAPAFLDADAVDAYSNGKVPMRISWIEWEGGSVPKLKINDSSVDWEWNGWECDITCVLQDVDDNTNKKLFQAGAQSMNTVRVNLEPGENEFTLGAYKFTQNILGLKDSTRILWIGDPNTGNPAEGSWSQIDSQ